MINKLINVVLAHARRIQISGGIIFRYCPLSQSRKIKNAGFAFPQIENTSEISQHFTHLAFWDTLDSFAMTKANKHFFHFATCKFFTKH